MKIISLVMLVMLGLPSCAFAEWQLLNDESTINYVSIKSSKVGEVNSFKKLTGSINENGAVSLNINLGSVETNIPIRNERMKSMLFEIGEFADAKITGSVDLAHVSKLEVGDTYTDSIKLKLSLHGVSKEVTGDVQITKLTHKRLLVTSVKPVVISAEDYNLADGIEKLRLVASLPAISTVVPVTYSLVFKQ